MKFSAQKRQRNIQRLKEDTFDVLVIGGGVTGAGLALQGGARGMKIGLIEMQDYASGTSSRSTKLVHGGLRYLKQFEVELVADVARERAVIGKNGPHVVKPTYMLMPVYDEPGASFNDFSAEVVLHLYDYLGNVKEKWSHYFVDKAETLKEEPHLKEKGLLKGGFYLDYTNDDARLTLETLKKADELGATLANYVKAVDFLYEDQEIVGVKAKDMLTGETFEIKADVVVNASGPWSDIIRKELNDEKEQKMYPTKGVHFVVDHEKLPVKRTIYTDTGEEDNRMIFIIPRSGKTYFGTTDTPFEGEYNDPEVTKEDIDYLLRAINYRFPEVALTLADIEASWSGLRPLVQDENKDDPSGISRGHEVFVSDGNLVTIAGGKLTDYRHMADDTFVTIDQKLKEKGSHFASVDTSTISLSGGELPEGMSFEMYVDHQTQAGMAHGLTRQEARELVDWYGKNVEKVFSYKERAEEMNMPLRVALQLAYALEQEMTLTLEDFFARRTELLLFDHSQVHELRACVANEMAEYLNWDKEEKERENRRLNDTIEKTTLARFK